MVVPEDDNFLQKHFSVQFNLKLYFVNQVMRKGIRVRMHTIAATALRRVQLKCDGTRWRKGGEVEEKLANGVGSQYPSHYLGTWCIQHYYRWCAHLGCQQSTELTSPRRFKWTRPFRAKDEIWFLRVCHHISNAMYLLTVSLRHIQRSL